MFYVRKKGEEQYLYYINGDNVSFSKFKDAIPLETLDQAKSFKAFAEKHTKDISLEIIKVETTYQVIND